MSNLSNLNIIRKLNFSGDICIENEKVNKEDDDLIEEKEKIEKGLFSYNGLSDKAMFIKTGKEVMDKLREQNNRLEIQISMLKKECEELKTKIPTLPEEDYSCNDNIDDIDNENKIIEKIYTLTNDDYASLYDITKYNNSISLKEDFKKENDISKNKVKYNQNIRDICFLKNKILENNVLLRNMNSKQKINLTSRELKELRF